MAVNNFRLLTLAFLFVSAFSIVGTTQEPTSNERSIHEKPVISAESTSQVASAPLQSAEPSDEPCWWIGLACAQTPEVLNAQLNIDGGLAVNKLALDAPAVQAGFQVHDIILNINGHAIQQVAQLDSLIRAAKGAPLNVEILRRGVKSSITVAPVRRRPCNEAETIIIEVNSDQKVDSVKLQEIENFLKTRSGDSPAQVIIVRPGVRLRRLESSNNELTENATAEGRDPEELFNLNLRLEQLDLEGALLSVADLDQPNSVSGCPHRLAEKIDQAIAQRKAELQELLQANANFDQVVNGAVSDDVPAATLKRLRLRISEVESYLETLEEARMLLQKHLESRPQQDQDSEPAGDDQSHLSNSGQWIWS